MIINTFCHIPTITSKDEKMLWNSGIYKWESYSSELVKNFKNYKLKKIEEYLDISHNNLINKNPHFFAKTLKNADHWRLFREFRESIAYIDIETTGLTEYDNITTIALYDGKDIKTYVNGRNLESFQNDIQNYKIIVTYNGKCFDVPFIKRSLGIEMNHVHIDLRYVLYSLGYKGGLKACEKRLGISRNELENIDGYFAVVLWNEYQKTKNEELLNTLLAYNIEDVINLELLMVIAYNIKLSATPLKDLFEIPMPERPNVSFKPNINLVNKNRYKRLARINYF